MWIVRKINNNCALARDNSGQDVVVFGKGIGFRRPPYELDDLSMIDRTFYGVRPSSLAMLESIPEDILLLASDAVEYARDVLDVDLNPNVPITLADHIDFAIRRVGEGVDISTPLPFDVGHFYPKEMRVGRRACSLVKTRLGVELPESEQVSIALHIIDAEAERSDMHATKVTAEIVAEVMGIVERGLGAQLDRESFAYSRFTTHLRFLVGRLLSGEEVDDRMSEMLEVMQGAYPRAHAVACEVVSCLADRGWTCSRAEELYLLIHIQRLAGGIDGR